MKFSITTVFLLSALTCLSGCSSLAPKEQRTLGLKKFLNLPHHYVLYLPAILKTEEKLSVLGLEDAGAKLTRKFNLPDPQLGLMQTFLKNTPQLTNPEIVAPENAENIPLGANDPVLFFHSDWQLIYRRLPPTFSLNQLRVGVVAKIIPLGQVLSGNGTLTVRTAAWEGNCYLEAFDGKYLHLDVWQAFNGEKLLQAIADAQKQCGEKLSAELNEQINALNILALKKN